MRRALSKALTATDAPGRLFLGSDLCFQVVTLAWICPEENQEREGGDRERRRFAWKPEALWGWLLRRRCLTLGPRPS